jgi:peptide/nickel transport system substrate-binding protein
VRKYVLATVGLSFGLVAATCLPASSEAGALKQPDRFAPNDSTQALTIDDEGGSLWTCSFNPVNPTMSNGPEFGFIYEPLIMMNPLQSGKTTPWLAKSYAWSNGNKTLTFTIRKGVKWDDGTPFSAADVVFTFKLLKQYPAADANAVWTVLDSVSQQGDNVVMNFKAPSVPYFYYIADQVPILPEHIWSKISNPLTYVDAQPVGTGPMVIHQCTPENVMYTANKDYWQPGLPKVQVMNFPAFLSNASANTYLETGQANWGGQFIPSIKVSYTSKSPYYHYWYTSDRNVDLFINLTTPQLDDVQVRQAMAYAINRNQVAEIGESGYEQPSNQAGIVTPSFASWLDKPLLSSYDYTYNIKRAGSILEADGYKKGSDGIFAKDGKQLSFSVINQGGDSDWVASLQVIAQQLKAAGIEVTVDDMSNSAYDNDLYKGQFQLAYGELGYGPSPYYELRSLLYSKESAPIGQVASGDYERYSSASTDALLDQYATTTNSATQHRIIDSLEKVMLSDVPAIPMTESTLWFQYDDQYWVGWPSPSDPYMDPDPGHAPFHELVLLHLRPR